MVTSAATCRYYRPEPVPREELHALFDAARFAPQGGNRQPVRWVVVEDTATKAQLKEWYLRPEDDYPHREATSEDPRLRRMAAESRHFVEHLDEVPVLVVACALLDRIHPADDHLDRFGIVGGASVYPSVQNLLLAARDRGLGAALTTRLCRFEEEITALLGIPDGVAVAGVLAIGYPARPFPSALRRDPVSTSVYCGHWGVPLFVSDGPHERSDDRC